MSSEIFDPEGLPQNKMRLRPISSITREEIIQKNLLPLQNMNQKKRAQEWYYSKQEGRSPLIEAYVQKAPVHARLGFKDRTKWKVPLIGINTSTLLPRNKYNLTKNRNNKTVSAQSRLLRYRQQNVNQQSVLMNSQSKRLRLQRQIPNLKVQVRNNNTPAPLPCTRFQLVLNPIYQEDIRQIQLSCPREIIHGVHPINPVCTRLTLNERFSCLV